MCSRKCEDSIFDEKHDRGRSISVRDQMNAKTARAGLLRRLRWTNSNISFWIPSNGITETNFRVNWSIPMCESSDSLAFDQSLGSVWNTFVGNCIYKTLHIEYI